MARFWYGQGITQVLLGAINLKTADIRVAALMSATTCDTEFDVANLAAFTAMDEPTGTGYARASLVAQNLTYTTVPDRRVEAKSSPVTLISNAGATGFGSVQAYLVFFNTGTDATSVPLIYDSTPALFPVTINATDNLKVTFTGDTWTYGQSDPLPA